MTSKRMRVVRQAGEVREPPNTFWARLRTTGPGLVIAASVVGSGELIATTMTGSLAGIWLLWLILIGCLVKVFLQVEIGRYCIAEGRGAICAMNEFPGPRLGISWLMWLWTIMMVAIIAQLGGIVHGVGQSLALAVPITGDYTKLLEGNTLGEMGKAASTIDDLLWSGIVTGGTIALLLIGSYASIETLSKWMVGIFTFVTVLCVIAVQIRPEWRMRIQDFGNGLSFCLPPAIEGITKSPIAVALATFGMIGMTVSDQIAYSYWCLEKGYAKWTGPRNETPAWTTRARGWLRTMRLDAGLCFVAYTVPTVSFYLLGATMLHRQGLVPQEAQMVRVLAEMYVPVFEYIPVLGPLIAPWGKLIFFSGVIAVLFSTFFVGTAGHARVCADALSVFGFGAKTERDRRWWVKVFSGSFPAIAFITLLVVRKPTVLILVGGFTGTIMLPLLGIVALRYRFLRCDKRIAPGRLWDVFLVLSVLILIAAAIAAAWNRALWFGIAAAVWGVAWAVVHWYRSYR